MCQSGLLISLGIWQIVLEAGVAICGQLCNARRSFPYYHSAGTSAIGRYAILPRGESSPRFRLAPNIRTDTPNERWQRTDVSKDPRSPDVVSRLPRRADFDHHGYSKEEIVRLTQLPPIVANASNDTTGRHVVRARARDAGRPAAGYVTDIFGQDEA